MRGNLFSRIVGKISMQRIILIMTALCMASCGMCGEEQLKEASSNSSKYVATVFRRGCGAMGGIEYHVNIRFAQESFSYDSRGVNEDGQVFLTKVGLINVNWKDDKTLVIDCEGCPAKIYPDNKRDKWQDVSIEYQFRERQDSLNN